MGAGIDQWVDENTKANLDRQYWRLVALVAAVAAVLGTCGMLWAVVAAGRRSPYVVRIDGDGRTTVVAEGLKYNPQAPEERYFLAQFAIKYFSRDELLPENFEYCLNWYFPESTRQAAKLTWKTEGIFEKYAQHTMTPVRVSVPPDGVRLSEDGTRAWIDMVWDTYGVQGSTQKRQTAYVQFYRLDSETPEMAIHNPLGFQIASLPKIEGAQ